MQQNMPNFVSEMDQLREMELGDRVEPIIRIVSTAVAGVLIYFYTGWVSALIWPIYFVFAWSVHSRYICTRQSFVSRSEIHIAAILFANLQLSFGWLPAVMFANEDSALMLVGGALMGAHLLFLVRRSDSSKLYQNIQIALVLSGSIAAYVSFFPTFQTPLAIIGPALAMLGINYYFVQSLRFARRMRMSREVAASQANQAKKMAAIGQLAGGVAHDFNNNLTVIMGNLELAALTEDPATRNADIQNALMAARQAATTVSQLMVFARLERPNTEAIPVSEIYDELLRLTKRLIPVSVTLETACVDPALHIRADRNQLLSGLINLVVNAVDAMAQGGALHLRTELTKIKARTPLMDGSLLDPGDYAEMTLADNGHGIPDDILPNVIDPFFTTKPTGKGTGLGLSMVSGMMKECGGGLSIASNASGTQVSLYFPLEDAAAEEMS
jgi:two-component system cell cycle sensor histidine kinase/response regulator CckA